jgi:nucleoside phosphorylase
VRDQRIVRGFDRRIRLPIIALAAQVAWALSATGYAAPKRGLCAAAAGPAAARPYFGVLSAFPAELAPLLGATEVERTAEIEGRRYYVGRLDGVRVVLGLTGIGLVNAERRTNALIDNFEVAAVLLSGVAGSRHRIGDVVLASQWTERDGPAAFEANRALLALAGRARKRLPPGSLDTCTPVPPTSPDAPVVCLPYDPAIILEGHGFSDDDFGPIAFPCIPGAGEVLGCEVPQAPAGDTTTGANAGIGGTAIASRRETSAPPVTMTITPAAAIAEDLVDMETAAVARVAAERGVPFLGVRAVSDGAGDPLGDRGFPAQFADYYRLAAGNAAVLTRAVVAEVARLARKRSARPICRLLAKGRWRRAAARIRAPTVTAAPGPGY